jgi:hyperosmotically inducible periplasmic protein
MRNRILALGIALIMFFALAACSNNKREANKLDKDQVRAALDNAGYKDVKFDIDNDKDVVTLTGDVPQADAKTKAEEAVKNVAGNYVIANEIAVRPEGMESQAKKVDSNLDDAIKSDWKALEAANKWGNQHINADVNNGVLTLKGDVDTESQRTQIEKSAAKLPNVQQVVNELQVKNAKNANKKKTTAAQE